MKSGQVCLKYCLVDSKVGPYPQLAADIIHLGRLKIAGLEIRVILRILLRLGYQISGDFFYFDFAKWMGLGVS